MATLLELETAMAALTLRVDSLESENATLVSRLSDLETGEGNMDSRLEWAEGVLGGPPRHEVDD